MTVTVGGNPVVIMDGDLIYYNGTDPAPTTLDDFFVVSTMQVDISGLVDDINEAAGGTFTFVTQGSPGTPATITVVTEEAADPSITIDSSTRVIATRGNIVPVGGANIETSGTTIISPADDVRSGLDTLNTKIDDLDASDIALNDSLHFSGDSNVEQGLDDLAIRIRSISSSQFKETGMVLVRLL